jgi:hypothetical protein
MACTKISVKTCEVCGTQIRSDNKYGVCRYAPDCRLKYGRRYREARPWLTSSKRDYHAANREAQLARMQQYGRTVHGKAVVLLNHAKLRAKRDGLPFALTLEWVEAKLEKAVRHGCPYLGIPIILDAEGLQPGSPSIDKINPKDGYHPQNCIIVSHKANAMKQNATVEEVALLAENLKVIAEDRFENGMYE